MLGDKFKIVSKNGDIYDVERVETLPGYYYLMDDELSTIKTEKLQECIKKGEYKIIKE